VLARRPVDWWVCPSASASRGQSEQSGGDERVRERERAREETRCDLQPTSSRLVSRPLARAPACPQREQYGRLVRLSGRERDEGRPTRNLASEATRKTNKSSSSNSNNPPRNRGGNK